MEGKIDWTKERTLKLIGCWKKCKCLYDLNHTGYRNRSSRQEALDEIARQMQKCTPQITVNDIKTKMTYLRSQYGRELNKNQSESEDSNYNAPYWFHSMSFLKSFRRVPSIAEKRDKIDDSLDNSVEEISCDEKPMPMPKIVSQEETSMGLCKPDPDSLESIQQTGTVTSSEPSTSSQSKRYSEAVTILQPTTSLHHTTSNNTSSEYDQTFMSFLKINLALVTDISLKEELLDKITMLLMDYKTKQRQIDSQKK